MLLKDISFPSPEQNLTYDDLLLHLAEKEGADEVLRFWESPQIFIVLGRIGNQDSDINVLQAEQDGIPILRRSSGGGTVVQGPGCFNYTLVLSKLKHPELNDLRKSYQWVSEKVVGALKECGVEAFFKPISDLATGLNEKKFSGNAQRRAKHYILHHGTILYRFDLSLISRYLKIPTDIPEYRKGRSHLDFVTNIQIDPQSFKSHLAQSFQATSTETSMPKELLRLENFLDS